MIKPKSILILLYTISLNFSSCGQSLENVNASTNYKNEILNPAFFDRFLGDYMTPDKEVIVIGRSQKKLFVYFEKTRIYRGLNRINDTVWTGGNTVIDTVTVKKFRFYKGKLEVFENDQLIINAEKTSLYKTENIFFTNQNNTKLGGTIFKPLRPNGKAIVIVHGSGNQDRNGNNACIRILADVLVRKGITVFTFDKQGVGSSEGNWEKLNFSALANDALSGIKYLKDRSDLKLTKIGLGGYSQAGWVIARAVEQSKNVDFVVALNAAGSGITVAEQNIYDVKTQMQCENKFSGLQRAQITSQQKYFFDYLLHRKNADKLNALTGILKKDTLLKEWLYPNTSEIDFNDKTQWYNALEVGFNPLPIWKHYQKPTLVIVSEFDDSTPASMVQSKIKQLNNKNITIKFLKDCQHLGLETNSVCNAKIISLDKFSPIFFMEIIKWIERFNKD
jgi:alpha/beta superfamily hydrolase